MNNKTILKTDNFQDYDIKLAGEACKYLDKDVIKKYNHNLKKLEYWNVKFGKKITELPVSINDNDQFNLLDACENINTDYILDIKKIDSKQLNQFDIEHNDIKDVFRVLMQKQDIILQGRGVIKILTDIQNSVFGYYVLKQKLSGDVVTIQQDDELYNIAGKVIENIKKRLDIVSKINKICLMLLNNGVETIFDGLSKNKLLLQNVLDFLNGKTTIIIQEIVLGNQELLIIHFRLRKDGTFSFDIKNSKAVKLDGSRFLKMKLSPQIDVQNYKITFESGSVFKLKFDAMG